MGETLSFRDIIKKSILEEFTYSNQPLTLNRMVITLLITFIIGLFIFFVYKKTYKGVLYTRSFNVALILVALVTSMIIMPITSNLVLSLGMVGALSIVRFRTAIKDPMDIGFMFWAISAGLTSGAGFYVLTISGSIIIGLILIILSGIKFRGTEPYLLVIHYRPGMDAIINRVLPKHKVKSKTVTKDGVELTLEVRVSRNNTSFLNNILRLEGVKDASLICYNGDYVS
ncbi:MAG TPA: DUF4956 domain-containing protein [Clostridiales bacterium]|nr:DUF4956 domain-containing protein [Clostridiales bacterium]